MIVSNNIEWKYFSPRFEYEKSFMDLDRPWAGHKYFIYDLIRNIKPKVIVELGTERGTSFLSMSQAVKDDKLKTKLYAIDTWEGDVHTGYYNNSVYKNFIKYKINYYSDLDTTVFRKLFDDVISHFKVGSIDILHIDGLHTYDAVKHDYDTWHDKVKPGGVIVFHDICIKKRGFGVYKLWDVLKVNFDTIEFAHSNGLGVLINNNKQFFLKIKSLESIWQRYYSILYEYNLSKRFDNTSNEIKVRDDEIERLRLELQENEKILDNITSAKVFKAWQFYCKMRDSIIK
jgi:hypothetical protein